MDVEPTTAVRQAEVAAQRTMLDRTLETFGIWPQRLAADTGYGSAANLHWLVEERGIEPHVPVFDKPTRTDGTFSRADFAYDHETDSYTCPGGKQLRLSHRAFKVPRSPVNKDGMLRYRARETDCRTCALKPRCTPSLPARKILRSIYEGARDFAREIATTDAFLVSKRE